MKKKIIAVITVLVMSLMMFTGCGANKFSKVKIRDDFKQDYNYVVHSNGGNVVQYGDYLYFINGTRGYDDTDGKNNVFGNVVKGALYKAKLIGEKRGREFENDLDGETGLGFLSHEGKVHSYLEEEDEDEEIVDIVDVQVIAPKVIGTSGYKKGGIYIYDDYVYYASPNNTKNKQGTVQVSKTDFFRTKLDGSSTQLIFTTEEDSADKPYAFYKQGDTVYLVCYYGTKIVSVAMNGGKVGKAMVLTDKATGVLFPARDAYDSENNVTNSPEDFIYYTRDLEEDDLQRSGNAVVVMRPDGSERFNLLMTGATVTLETVSGGALFYRTTDGIGNTVIKMDNMHNVLMDNSASYKAYEESVASGDNKEYARSQVDSEVMSVKDMSTYTSVYCFRDNLYTNVGNVIGFTSSAVYRISSGSQNMRILNSAATMQFVTGNYMYYTNSDGTTLYRTDFTKADTAKDEPETIASELVTGGLDADYAAGFVMYFGKVDDWASGYAFFKYTGAEGVDATAVYDRAVTDRKPEPSDEAESGDETTDGGSSN